MGLDERVKYAAMKARHQKKLRPWYKKSWGIIIIILIFAFVVSFFYYVSQVIKYSQESKQDQGSYTEEMTASFLEVVNRPSANTYGPVDAKVKIVEFADFSCPYCEKSYHSLKNIKEKYGDQVRIVYRDFPLHENSIFLSLSARCAGEQGEFWKMHDLFYENQDRFQVSQSELQIVMPEIAEAIDLDREKFETCIKEQRYFPQIEQDYEDANFLQIQGTPTWFINNTPFTGHLPEDELERLVKGLLTNSGSKNLNQ